MEPLDGPFESTPFFNARKQRVREVVEEYFYYNGDVYEMLDLDDDDLEMVEDYLDINPNDGFVDIKEKEFEKRKCKLLRIPYFEPALMTEEKFLVTKYKFGLNERCTFMEILESM
nr:hypothetical protein [Tanacetum cinerariifolium]